MEKSRIWDHWTLLIHLKWHWEEDLSPRLPDYKSSALPLDLTHLQGKWEWKVTCPEETSSCPGELSNTFLSPVNAPNSPQQSFSIHITLLSDKSLVYTSGRKIKTAWRRRLLCSFWCQNIHQLINRFILGNGSTKPGKPSTMIFFHCLRFIELHTSQAEDLYWENMSVLRSLLLR